MNYLQPGSREDFGSMDEIAVLISADDLLNLRFIWQLNIHRVQSLLNSL
jgi:hypothetical protein